ncbi:DEAD/DEAH box helicase [candidate division WWE3 bacterium]|nr:DEAD/DEAH box helicase [candidate division WWE3 bacterium]
MRQKKFFRHGSGQSNRNKYRGKAAKPASAQTNIAQYRHTPTENVEVAAYDPKHCFNDFPIHQILKHNIQNRNYVNPTPIQDQSIPEVLKGRDVIGIANTGTGKTAAFLIPMIDKVMNKPGERVLIILPTRELANQVFQEFKAFSRGTHTYAAVCIGGSGMHHQKNDLLRNPAFVIGTPGRLKDFIQQGVLKMNAFTNVVLDEVDRMVDIGFIKDIKYMISLLPQNRQSLFFSATLSREVDEILNMFVKNPIRISVKTHETSQTIHQDVIKYSNSDDRMQKLVELLKKPEFNKVIIFGKTKWGVEKLSKHINREGFRSESIHGNKKQNQRQRALDDFKLGRTNILVATDVAARGIDVPDVSHVINFDEPASYDDYVHRIGRTGRANKQGYALTFVNVAA